MGSMKNQMNVSVWRDEPAQLRTNKKEFLEQMERLIPWREWKAIIEPRYYKEERGNKPYDLELMLRLFVVRNLYSLSDMATRDEAIDSRAFSAFCGTDRTGQVPEGDTIGHFRRLLEKHGIQEHLFAQVRELLIEKGLLLKKGTIVYSTFFIEAPSSTSSTKNREKKRDPEAHSGKKGSTRHFGYKSHIGVDKDSGLAHTTETAAANVSDVSVTPKLLHGEEESVNGDSGHIGAEKREDAVLRNKKGKKIKRKINRRPSQHKNNSARSRGQIKRCEKEKPSVRSKAEHVFGVVKNLFGYRKTRYRGLAKQNAKLNVLFALANLYLAGKRGLAA